MSAVAMKVAREELDELTVRRAQKGDGAACRALVERYQRPVFALLSRLLFAQKDDRALVEDLAQETFLRLFRALPEFSVAGPAKLSTFVLTIATRLGIDELRRKRPLVPLDGLVDVPAGERSDAVVAAKDQRAAIERAIAELSPEHRAAFLLREVHELDYAEIGRALDVDVGTVKSRLSRARERLRAALEEVYHE